MDGVTAEEDAHNLAATLSDLLERIKSGRYQAPPVRRVYIPKGDGAGSRRPLGLPTFEDKVAPRAIVMGLEAIYEQDVRRCPRGWAGSSATTCRLPTWSWAMVRIKRLPRIACAGSTLKRSTISGSSPSRASRSVQPRCGRNISCGRTNR